MLGSLMISVTCYKYIANSMHWKKTTNEYSMKMFWFYWKSMHWCFIYYFSTILSLIVRNNNLIKLLHELLYCENCLIKYKITFRSLL